MPPQARLDALGTLYHVRIRGSEGKRIFRDTQHRKDFVTRLGDLSKQTASPSSPGPCWGTMFMDIESRVWGFDDGDSEAVRGLHLGNRQSPSKNGGEGLSDGLDTHEG